MSERFAAWVSFRWTEPFMWKRLACLCVTSLLPAAICFALNRGLLGLLLMAVGTWPFPLRLSVSASGVTCSWLFVSQTISIAEIDSVRVIADPRRWAIFRGSVLALERRGGRELLMFAKQSTLSRLESAIQKQRALRGTEIDAADPESRKAFED